MPLSRLLLVRVLPPLAALVVAAGSFALSYVALRDVAARTDAVPDHLAWIVPICVDGAVLAASATAWAASLQGRRPDAVAVSMIVVLLLTSVVINVDHAGPLLMAKAIAAIPPLTLLGCLELVAGAYRRDVRDAVVDPATTEPATAATRPAPKPVTAAARPAPARRPEAVTTTRAVPAHISEARPGPRAEAPTAELSPESRSEVAATRPAGTSSTAAVRQLFADHVAAGGDPNDPTLSKTWAHDLNVSPATVRKALGPLRRGLQDAAG